MMQPRDVGEDRLAALAVPDRAAGEVAADRHPQRPSGSVHVPFERQRIVAASLLIWVMAGQM